MHLQRNPKLVKYSNYQFLLDKVQKEYLDTKLTQKRQLSLENFKQLERKKLSWLQRTSLFKLICKVKLELAMDTNSVVVDELERQVLFSQLHFSQQFKFSSLFPSESLVKDIQLELQLEKLVEIRLIQLSTCYYQDVGCVDEPLSLRRGLELKAQLELDDKLVPTNQFLCTFSKLSQLKVEYVQTLANLFQKLVLGYPNLIQFLIDVQLNLGLPNLNSQIQFYNAKFLALQLKLETLIWNTLFQTYFELNPDSNLPQLKLNLQSKLHQLQSQYQSVTLQLQTSEFKLQTYKQLGPQYYHLIKTYHEVNTKLHLLEQDIVRLEQL